MAAPTIAFPGEVWKPVEGFKGRYEVSDLGRVRALDGNRFMEAVLSGQEPPKIIRSQHLAGNGYLTISFTWDRKVQTFHVHSLVCQTFLGARPARHHAGHRDGDKTNNTLENLRWVTAADNEADKILHGTRKRGSDHPAARLCDDDVRTIRARLTEGEPAASIAADYPVSRSLIQRIGAGKVWAWLE